MGSLSGPPPLSRLSQDTLLLEPRGAAKPLGGGHPRQQLFGVRRGTRLVNRDSRQPERGNRQHGRAEAEPKLRLLSLWGSGR